MSRMNCPASIVLTIAIYFMLVYLGIRIAVKRRGEAIFFPSDGAGKEAQGTERESAAKILDTSVIIDGRIFDIENRFYRRALIIPSFVLNELWHYHPWDALKRTEAEGFDVLNQIQKN